MESYHQAKRKFPAADEEDLTKRVRVGEESTTTFPSSSLSSTSHRVGPGSTVTGGEQRGEKRAAEDPPADCGQEDSFNEELRAGDGTSMECLSFQEYCDSGGLWIANQRKIWRKHKMNPFQLQLSKVFFMKSSGMTEQGSYWIPRKSERPLDRRVWVEADVEECWNKKEEGP